VTGLILRRMRCAAAVMLLPVAAPAQAPAGRLSDEGVYRAAALVDSVFADRAKRESIVEGADFASYLVARLGVRPIPPDLALEVAVDSSGVRIGGRVDELPPDVKVALGAALAFLAPSSVVTADVVLAPARRGVVRFHLRSILVNGFPVPEPLLVPLMAEVGTRYPALTKSGRDLLVAIPDDGEVQLLAGTVRVAIAGALESDPVPLPPSLPPPIFQPEPFNQEQRMSSDQQGGTLKPVSPARVAEELTRLSASRKSGELDQDEYEHRFSRMITELRDRRIDGSRTEILAVLGPLKDTGVVTLEEWVRLTRQLGLA
jgi:hypothetical protein